MDNKQVEEIKKMTEPKEVKSRFEKEINLADGLYKSLDAIKDALSEDEWLYLCYGMYIGMRYSTQEHNLARMVMLEKLANKVSDIQKFQDKWQQEGESDEE